MYINTFFTNVHFNNGYVLIEVPEFEKKNLENSNFFFNIFGINSEKPIIRINNILYEGKWHTREHIFSFCKSIQKEIYFYNSIYFFEKSFDSKLKKTSNLRCSKSKFFIEKYLKLHKISFLIDFL